MKFRWLELLYLFSGHFVVIFSTMMALHAISNLSPDSREKLAAAVAPYWLLLVCCVAAFVCFFSFALICSCAPVLLMMGHPSAAERLYRFTLSLRQKSALGKARIQFWNISIANCLRQQGRYAEAEVLYKTVIDAPEQGGFLDRLTNHGLKDAAAENYAYQLHLQNRDSEEEAVRKLIGSPLAYLRLKYGLVSITVLTVGSAFALWLHHQIAELFKY